MPIGRQIKIVSVNGGSSGSPVAIDPGGHPWIVAMLDTGSSGDAYFRLPASAAIGDVVEVYYGAGSAVPQLSPPAGEFFSPSTSGNVSINTGAIFRKVASDQWGKVS